LRVVLKAQLEALLNIISGKQANLDESTEPLFKAEFQAPVKEIIGDWRICD